MIVRFAMAASAVTPGETGPRWQGATVRAQVSPRTVHVRDLEVARRFYADVLGFDVAGGRLHLERAQPAAGARADIEQAPAPLE